MPRAQKRFRWVYFLPVLHLCACLISMIGHVIPELQYLGIVWVVIMLVDIPVSALAYVLAWNHGTIAGIWILVAGTLWWCLLGLGIDILVDRRKARTQSR